jgi:hypothetical protein
MIEELQFEMLTAGLYGLFTHRIMVNGTRANILSLSYPAIQSSFKTRLIFCMISRKVENAIIGVKVIKKKLDFGYVLVQFELVN